MSDLKRVSIEELKVGDIICVPFDMRLHGFKDFRYPIYKETVVEKITPKKTKLVVQEWGEISKTVQRYLPNEETTRRTVVAEAYNDICYLINKLDRKVDFKSLKDDTLVEVARKIREAMTLIEEEE